MYRVDPACSVPPGYMFSQNQFVTMQYSVVLLLIIITYQAARAFRADAFRTIAVGWVANFAYLATIFPANGLSVILRIPPSHAGALARFFDFRSKHAVLVRGSQMGAK